MNDTIIYITGSIGFKSALVDLLARGHDVRDISTAVISLALTEAFTLEDLKVSLGDEFLSEHRISFHTQLPSNHSSLARPSRAGEFEFKMSIWANRDSTLTGTPGKGHKA
jgi:hypothetical protein